MNDLSVPCPFIVAPGLQMDPSAWLLLLAAWRAQAQKLHTSYARALRLRTLNLYQSTRHEKKQAAAPSPSQQLPWRVKPCKANFTQPAVHCLPHTSKAVSRQCHHCKNTGVLPAPDQGRQKKY